MPAATPSRFPALVLPPAAALAYAFGHLGWYLGTPLGRVPVLDERENIDLARAIGSGTLAHEPFYRALGYPAVLASLRWLGVEGNALFPAALVLGAILHAINAALAAKIAGRWFGPSAGLIAGLLCAFDPVLVHYATQALDATLGLTFFLAGLNFLAAAAAGSLGAASAHEKNPAPAFTGASLAWALATLVRPNYLAVWVLAPLFAAFWVWRLKRGADSHTEAPAGGAAAALAGACAGAILFAGAAFIQWRVSGEAGFLPSQGAYNLWAANRPGANGRYYSQQMSLPPELAGRNPARIESMILYQKETGRSPDDFAAMNAYWRARFFREAASHPVRWLRLLGSKAYSAVNDWEQYNNKTFSFHKARSPWLRWNPLSWGLILVPAVAGAARLAGEPASRQARAALAVALAAAAMCTASLLLFFTSARFRLPLAPLCAVLAAGALASPFFWRTWSQPARLGLGAAAAFTAFAAFSRFGGVQDKATYVQDHVLLARAAYSVQDDALALSEARAALALRPGHPDAMLIARQAAEALRAAAPSP